MKLVRSLLLSVVLGACALANATSLQPGTTTSLIGTNLATSPWLDGFVDQTMVDDFFWKSGNDHTSGTVTSSVVLAFDGTYDFQWSIANDIFSDGAVATFQLGDFFAGAFDADWLTDSVGDLAPSAAELLYSSGDVNFYFAGPGLAGGIGSYTFFLDTQATAYATSAFYSLVGTDGVSTQAFATFAPVLAPVPEPQVWALMAAGLAGLLMFVPSARSNRREAMGRIAADS